MKTKKKAIKKAAEKDDFGFRKNSKSSQAVKMLAAGKTSMKAVRSKFKTLSFFRLLKAIQKNGFKVSEDSKGLCSITAKAKGGV